MTREPAASRRPFKACGEAGFSLASALAILSNLLYNTTMEKTERLSYQREEHRIHLIVYHLLWCPRRRKPILVGALKDRCQHLIEMKCTEKGWEILSLAIQPDHIHLFVRATPSESAADVVKEIKGITSFHLRREFPDVLTKLPSTWTRSYFASTAPAVSAQTIQAYVDAQKGV